MRETSCKYGKSQHANISWDRQCWIDPLSNLSCNWVSLSSCLSWMHYQCGRCVNWQLQFNIWNMIKEIWDNKQVNCEVYHNCFKINLHYWCNFVGKYSSIPWNFSLGRSSLKINEWQLCWDFYELLSYHFHLYS